MDPEGLAQFCSFGSGAFRQKAKGWRHWCFGGPFDNPLDRPLKSSLDSPLDNPLDLDGIPGFWQYQGFTGSILLLECVFLVDVSTT